MSLLNQPSKPAASGHRTLHPLPASARKLLAIAQWVPLLVLSFLLFLAAYLAVNWATGGTEGAAFVRDLVGLETSERLPPASGASVGLALGIWFASLTSVMAALWLTFQLLRSYAAGHIFSLLQADRLRRIGWMMVLAAPLMMIGHTLGVFILARSGSIEIEIGIEDVHLLMLAFGLLVVVVGHVMRTALAIAEENETFV